MMKRMALPSLRAEGEAIQKKRKLRVKGIRYYCFLNYGENIKEQPIANCDTFVLKTI